MPKRAQLEVIGSEEGRGPLSRELVIKRHNFPAAVRYIWVLNVKLRSDGSRANSLGFSGSNWGGFPAKSVRSDSSELICLDLVVDSLVSLSMSPPRPQAK